MLHLHTSNQLETLLDALVDVVREPLPSPLEPETIIVQSRGMERWLALQLADRLGVWGNAEYPFPLSFIRKLFAANLPDVPFDPTPAPYGRETLTWAILRQLDTLPDAPTHDSLRHYLGAPQNSPGSLKHLQLASRIAYLFDQYIIFRPELLRAWEGKPAAETSPDGPHIDWQRALWRTLRRDHPYDHRDEIRRQFLALPLDQLHLPSRLTLFGLSNLPPFYLGILDHIAQATDVHLFTMAPCQEYWADVANRRFIARLQREGKRPEELHFQEGNPLLASLGKQGGEYQHALIGLEHVASHHDTFTPFLNIPGETKPDDAPTALQRIQQDILTLSAQRDTYPLDDSIQFHSCHGPMREVQVLRDQLLHLVETLPGLQFHDIIVLSPDIETYAAPIRAVFGDDLPHSVADRSSRVTNEVGDALLALIDLLTSRFEASRVLDFLSLAPVRIHHGFTTEDLDPIRDWVQALNIRWGRDANHRAAEDLPPTHLNTWRQALDRLQLGFLMGADDDANTFYATEAPDAEPAPPILPYPHVEGQAAERMGRLVAAIDALARLAETIDRPRTLTEWEADLTRLLDPPDGNDTHTRDWREITDLFQHLANQQELAAHQPRLAADVIRHVLADALTGTRSEAPFLGGGITCCNLVPMRSVPFRVVCLIGMNDTDFPRAQPSLSFDLIQRHPRRGDRSRREDDRYLFLEAIVSARDVLYCSYTGQSIHNNEVIPPSVLIAELLDYLHDTTRQRPVVHPLQAFSPRYFTEDAGPPEPLDGHRQLFSFDPLNLDVARRSLQPAEPTLRFAEDTHVEPLLETSVATFCDFFRSPPDWFLRHQASLRFVKPGDADSDRVPTELDALERYHVRQTLLQSLPENTADQHALIQSRRSVRELGLLPHGTTGEFLVLPLQHHAIIHADALAAQRPAESERLRIDQTIAGLRLLGTVQVHAGNQLITARFGRSKARLELELWIQAMLVQLQRDTPDVTAKGIWFENRRSKTVPINLPRKLERTRDILAELVRVFQRGRRRPLPFFPETAKAYLCAKNQPASKLRAAQTAWDGPWSMTGERDTLTSARLLYPDGNLPLDDEAKELMRIIGVPLWAPGRSGDV